MPRSIGQSAPIFRLPVGIHEGWTLDRCLHLAHRAATAALRGATATDGIPPLGVLLG
jgi:hypothetical protein